MARKKIRGKAGVKFKSPYTSEKRDSQLRTLVTHLIINEEVKVTETTAKSVVSLASKMITFGKKGDLHSRRLAAAVVRPMLVNENQTALQKLFDELAPRYASRNGGYVRVLKLGNRRGDNAPIVVCQLVK
jgi:large subunit ribosomal protein L17